MTTLNVPLIRGCARCGLDHTDMVFREMDNPIEANVDPPYRWWASCPTNGQPLLIRETAKWEEAYAKTKENPRYLAPDEYRSIDIKIHRKPEADQNGAESG